MLQPLGRLAEAEQLLREAERDPLADQVRFELARVLITGNRPADAIAILQPLRHTESGVLPVDLYLGRALVLEGRSADALPMLERRRERLIDPEGGPHPWVAWAYVKLGRRADAEKLAQLNDRLPLRRAVINAALGNTDRMFSGLEEMFEREPQRVGHLMREPEFSPFRQDERFTSLLRRMNQAQ